MIMTVNRNHVITQVFDNNYSTCRKCRAHVFSICFVCSGSTRAANVSSRTTSIVFHPVIPPRVDVRKQAIHKIKEEIE